MTGSRLLNGTTHLHEELEGRIARFFARKPAFVSRPATRRTSASISALVNKRAVSVVDKADHASIYDGCTLADGEMFRFRHNDVEHLDSVLAKIDGDKAALVDHRRRLQHGRRHRPSARHRRSLPEAPGARLLVDDAHAIGVIGVGGRGTGSHFGLEDAVDLIMGTFSKSLASIGGFFAGERKVVEWIKHFGRPLVFSASLPPASVAAALAALDILEQEPERVEQLKKISAMWRDGIRGMGIDIGPTESPIVPIKIGERTPLSCSGMHCLKRASTQILCSTLPSR